MKTERIFFEFDPYGVGFNAYLERKGWFLWNRTGVAGWGRTREEAEANVREKVEEAERRRRVRPTTVPF